MMSNYCDIPGRNQTYRFEIYHLDDTIARQSDSLVVMVIKGVDPVHITTSLVLGLHGNYSSSEKGALPARNLIEDMKKYPSDLSFIAATHVLIHRCQAMMGVYNDLHDCYVQPKRAGSGSSDYAGTAAPPSLPGSMTVASRQRPCPSCGGRGRSTCTACGGLGSRTEMRDRYDPSGYHMMVQETVPCYMCSGGQTMCSQCGGRGEVFM